MKVGSHNSASYTIDWNVSFWSAFSIWEWIRIAAKYIKSIRNIVERLTYNQNKDILQQLQCGIDILDLRVSRSKHGLFYTSHTFCCASLADVLAQLLYALEYEDIPTPITLLIYADSRNNTLIGHERHLLQLLTILLSPYLQKGFIVAYYQTTAIKLDDFKYIKCAGTVNKVWLNVDTPVKFIKKYKAIVATLTEQSGLDCVLTPSLNLRSIYYSVWQLSLEIKKALIGVDFLYNDKEPKLAFYMFDYVDADIVNHIKNKHLA
jgi:hypothetical protein